MVTTLVVLFQIPVVRASNQVRPCFSFAVFDETRMLAVMARNHAWIFDTFWWRVNGCVDDSIPTYFCDIIFILRSNVLP